MRDHIKTWRRSGFALLALAAGVVSGLATLLAISPEELISKAPLGGNNGRSGAVKEKMLKECGGTEASEAAVARGLEWLVRQQANDGHWSLADADVKDDVATNSLALLPFLGTGVTHRSVLQSPYAKNVDKGLKWLLGQQAKDGGIGEGYAHALATIVLCESYDLTSDPFVKPMAQKAVDKIVDWQGKNGGFADKPKEDGNTSATGWHLQALTAARWAGLQVPKATLTNVNSYFDSVASDDGSKYGATNQKDVDPRTIAVGLLSREYLGWGPRTPELLKGVEHLKSTAPVKVQDMVFYYYATRVMYNLGSVQAEAWERWNVPLRDHLLKTQDQGQNADKRDQKGSWDPTGDVLADQFGRLGYTSLCLLTLEVYYRQLPLYGRHKRAIKDAPVPIEP